MTTEERVEAIFTYHAPTPPQVEQLQKVRAAAKALATVIMENTPMCADQSAALRKLREAVMTANASIVLEGKS